MTFYLTKILMLKVKLITLNRTIKSTFHVKDGNNKMFIIIQLNQALIHCNDKYFTNDRILLYY